jgi:archaellin
MTHYLIENDEKTADNNPMDIAIIMSNIDLLTESQTNGVNYVCFDFQGVELQTGTITNISDYTILENASFNNSEIDNGTTILDDAESRFTASNTFVTVNSLSSSQINFGFTFTRKDGEIMTGNYSGNYADISQ